MVGPLQEVRAQDGKGEGMGTGTESAEVVGERGLVLLVVGFRDGLSSPLMGVSP